MEGSHKLILVVALLVVSAAAVTVNGKRLTDDNTICGVRQAELMECKPAAAANTATPPEPTASCCAALKHADLTCFCGFKNSAYLLGINGTRAMELPSLCDPTKPKAATCA